MKVGVLAFQGDVLEHMRVLQALEVEPKEVRSLSDFATVQGLIIPGGESTVISQFLDETGLHQKIMERSEKEQFPIYGTCAGAILLAKEVLSDGALEKRVHPLDLMDTTIERNAYGRQTESFEDTVMLEIEGKSLSSKAVFIRAPQVKRTGPTVRVLAKHRGYPVLLLQGSLLASTFHPELTGGISVVHQFFLSIIRLRDEDTRNPSTRP